MMCAARVCLGPGFLLASRSLKLSLARCQLTGAVRWKHSASPPYKAVVFDMGGVLLPSPYQKATEWELQHGVPAGTIVKAIRTGGDSNAWMRYMRGELSATQFTHAFGKECAAIAGCPVPVNSFLSDLTSGPMAQQNPAMSEAILCIRAEGLKTAVLSNNFYLQHGHSYLPLDRTHFHVIVESCREGLCKPDPRIYRLCVDRLGVLPEETVFLDDVGQNVKAAAQLGLRTIKVEDPAVAVQELEGLLGFPLRGFVPGTRAVRRGMDIPVDPLRQYLQSVLPLSSAESLTLRQFSHGQSNPTYLLNTGGRHLVLRKKPPGALLPSAHAVEREFRVMKALGDAGVPVPKVLALCEDPSVIGTPFFLMEYCPGRIFKDPSLPGLRPDERREVYQAMNRVLCQIHSADISAVGLRDYGKSGEGDAGSHSTPRAPVTHIPEIKQSCLLLTRESIEVQSLSKPAV